MIDKVADPALRAELRDQVETIMSKRSFGLVFQEHRPETVELPDYRVSRGCKVRARDGGPEDPLFRVEKVVHGEAALVSVDLPREAKSGRCEDLVVVREFGEAIYPGLRSTGGVRRGPPEKPTHAVIEAENYHALEMLLYAYESKVDAIYIDPPYNTGARDWKYNNDYVDGVDQYRHSKWLAFIERRLALAKRLLNPSSSVLVVTIDEKEVHHLGMLLEQMFPEAILQMVTIVINPLGQARKQELARVEEYAFFVFLGASQPAPGIDDLLTERNVATSVRWEWLLRGGTNSARRDRPNLFYPVFIDPVKRTIVGTGTALDKNTDRAEVQSPVGAITVWPLRRNGDEGNWRCSGDYLMQLASQGYAKVGAYDRGNDRWSFLYLGKAQIKRISTGEIRVVGRDANNSVILEGDSRSRSVVAKTVWSRRSHRAGEYGSALLRDFVPGRDFPFPKALYAVEDALRIATGGNPDALVLDFFVGSGTTLHAVARLNAEDGGRRQAIVVTNNEVSVSEATELRERGYRPGDEAWAERGIYQHITRPRIEAAVSGLDYTGQPIKGHYLDGSPFADGLDENVEFLTLTYEDADLVSLGRRFQAIAPLLWLKAGGRGERIDTVSPPWCVPPAATYGILFEIDAWRAFTEAVRQRQDLEHVFVVTDSETAFQQVIVELRTGLPTTQLYEDYLRNFAINTKGKL